MRVALVSIALCLASTVGVPAQQTSLEVPPPILTIDQDRLLQDSRLGSEKLGELEAEAEALAQENATIEAELVRQEQALTDERPSLDPQVFRDRAEAFDARVKRIRAEQDAKLRDLTLPKSSNPFLYYPLFPLIYSSILLPFFLWV